MRIPIPAGAAAFAIILGIFPAAAADTGTACAVGKKYIEAVQRKDFDTVVSLFAADAEFSTPTGPVLHGAEIGKFYKTTVASTQNLIVRAQSFVGSGAECYFEIWTKSKKNADGIWVPDADGEFIRGAIDHFTLDANGKVTRLVAFPAPTARMFK